MAVKSGNSKSWSVVICGDLPAPVGIFVPDPHKFTVSQLKEEVEKKTKIPANEQTLYFQETSLSDEILLDECQGIDDGVALCLLRKPFIINIYRPDIKVTVPVSIPKNELDDWTISTLHEYIFSTMGLENNCDHILVIAGTIVKKDSPVRLTECSFITDGCTMALTILKKVTISTPSTKPGKSSRSFYIPASISQKFITERISYQRSENDWKGPWTLHVQQLDGSKKILHLKKLALTAIYELRELVHGALSVSTCQQRLLVRNTILEDWDEDGSLLLVRNYPEIFDGATVYLVCLTEGIRVNLSITSRHDISMATSSKNLHSSTTSTRKFYPPSYINICNVKEMMLSRLIKIVSKCEGNRFCKSALYEVSSSSRSPGIAYLDSGHQDKNIASIAWLVDGCTISVKIPSTLSRVHDGVNFIGQAKEDFPSTVIPTFPKI